MKKIIIVVLLIVAVFGLSFVGQQARQTPEKQVQVFSVIEGAIESTVLATGTLKYGDERRLRSEVTARVIEVNVEEGDEVNEGQILIRLDPDDFENTVANQAINVDLRKTEIEIAELQIENLNIQIRRQQKLFDQGAAQSSTLEDLNNQFDQAIANLKLQRQILEQSEYQLTQAKKQLAKTIITAPISGLVSALDIAEGEMVIVSELDVPLLTLVDPTEILTEVDVDEADIGEVREGLPVQVFAVAYLDTALDGVVTDIATSARRVSGKNSLVFPVEVEITPIEGIILRPGMSTRAEIRNRTNIEYPLVPIETIQSNEDDDQYSVFVLKDGMAEKIIVTLGAQDDRYQAVTSGLEPGIKVVTGPYRVLRSLEEGDAIAVEAENVASRTY